jgi:hypothetical protein
VSDRVDYFPQAFGGFDPSGDPDAALKLVLNAIMMDDRLDELSSILTDGHEIGALEGEPGWTLQRRDSGPAGERPAYRSWPPDARFRAYVDPEQFRLGHSEAFASSGAFHKYVRSALAAYIARNPSNKEGARAISSLTCECP